MMISTGLNIIALLFFMFLIMKYADKKQLGRVIIPALLLKILSGLLVGVVFKFFYDGGDTYSYFEEGLRISDYIWQHPKDVFRVFYATDQIFDLWYLLHFQDQPRALFFSKIVAFFHLITHANYWLMSIYFSLISFVGALLLVNQLILKFSAIKTPAIVAFLYLPSVVFWSSGVLKESIAMFALYLMVAAMLAGLSNRNWKVWVWVLGFLLSGYLLWKLRYFYLGALLPLFVATLAALIFERHRHDIGLKKVSPLLIYFMIVVAGFFAMSKMHYNLHQDHIIDVLYQNYNLFAARSEPGSAVVFENLRPEIGSFLIYAPKALFTGLFRPNIWEIYNWKQLPLTLENFALLILTIIAFYNMLKNKPHISYWGMSLVLYVGILSILLVYASPNFGSLIRYRTGYLSFFVLMILYHNPVLGFLKGIFPGKKNS